MKTFLPHSAAVAQQWEIAKGHLRAVAALQGACRSDDGATTAKYVEIEAFTHGFIREFESRGFNEGID